MALLLDFGADVNHGDADGWTALHHAVDFAIDSSIQAGLSSGDEPLDGISGLIQYGASLNIRTVKEETPLDVARSYGSKRVQRARLRREPDGCFGEKRFVRYAGASGEVLLTSSQSRV